MGVDGEWNFAYGFGAFPTAEPWAFLGVGKSFFAVEAAARAGDWHATFTSASLSAGNVQLPTFNFERDGNVSFSLDLSRFDVSSANAVTT